MINYKDCIFGVNNQIIIFKTSVKWVIKLKNYWMKLKTEKLLIESFN